MAKTPITIQIEIDPEAGTMSMTKADRAMLRSLVLRVARTSYAEGVEEAGTGDGPELELRRRASRLALNTFFAALETTREEQSNG